MAYSSNDTISSGLALKKLMEGNQRYVTANQNHPNQTHQRRVNIADYQRPFATILGCSDSRVPPELIFDQGLGDLFIIRIAGNLIDDMVLGSLEYAAMHLHTPLIMVLGHSRCGAVQAAEENKTGDGHISYITEKIRPLIDKARNTEDVIQYVARANTKFIADQLRCSEPILSKMVRDNQLDIIPAFYELDSGVVEILSD